MSDTASAVPASGEASASSVAPAPVSPSHSQSHDNLENDLELHAAAAAGNADAVRQLLSSAANPNIRDSQGRTALKAALLAGQSGESTRLLLEADARLGEGDEVSEVRLLHRQGSHFRVIHMISCVYLCADQNDASE
jgi:ankyrin repeat protein